MSNNSSILIPEQLFDNEFIPKLEYNLPIGLHVRSLQIDDYENDYLKLLQQLTNVGNLTKEQFEQKFMEMKNSKSYFIVVIEDKDIRRVVGSATLVIEHKFIHEAGLRGRVEDVIIDQSMRGLKLGQYLNFILVEMAKKMGVYKLSLECKNELILYYEKFGYKRDVNFMTQRFK